jgi:hypothetical protein
MVDLRGDWSSYSSRPVLHANVESEMARATKFKDLLYYMISSYDFFI